MQKIRFFSFLLIAFTFISHSHTLAQELLPSDPDPNRFSSEINAFKAWDSKNTAPDEAILFVGSSSFRMWKTADAFPNYTVINRAFGGAHLTDLAFFYGQIIQPYQPSWILIYIGDNDIASGVNGDLFLKRYEEFTSRIWHDYPSVRIGFFAIKPSSSRWDYWPEMSRVNEIIKAKNEMDPRHFYFDLGRLLLNKDGKPDDSLFLSDLLHLNDDGYARWTQELTRLLSEL